MRILIQIKVYLILNLNIQLWLRIMATWSAKLTNEQSLHLELINRLTVSHYMWWDQTRIILQVPPTKIWWSGPVWTKIYEWGRKITSWQCTYENIYWEARKVTSFTGYGELKFKRETSKIKSFWIFENYIKC